VFNSFRPDQDRVIGSSQMPSSSHHDPAGSVGSTPLSPKASMGDPPRTEIQKRCPDSLHSRADGLRKADAGRGVSDGERRKGPLLPGLWHRRSPTQLRARRSSDLPACVVDVSPRRYPAKQHIRHAICPTRDASAAEIECVELGRSDAADAVGAHVAARPIRKFDVMPVGEEVASDSRLFTALQARLVVDVGPHDYPHPVADSTSRQQPQNRW